MNAAEDDLAPAVPIGGARQPREVRPDDGRRQRRHRNRDAVIDALLELVREGDLDPTVVKIAEQAGVSHRSVFRYFDDVGDLVHTAFEVATARAVPLSRIHRFGKGTLAERVDALTLSRVHLFDSTHGVGRVARAKSTVLAEVDEQLVQLVAMVREQNDTQFAPELRRLPDAERAAVSDAILMITSFESFDVHRRLLQRSNGEIIESWRLALHTLLDPIEAR